MWGRLLDETALAGEGHLDAESVAGYDRKASFDPSHELALLRSLGFGADSTLIDLGAGTGTLALAAAAVCEYVIAVDASPAMVAAMREKTERLGVANVECVQAGFLTYEHRGRPADIVFSRHALHHLPDLWKVIALCRLPEMLRVGGVLRLLDLVFSFDPAQADTAIARCLASAAERPEDGWTRAELESHLRDEYSTFTWLLEPMLERAGFEITEAAYDRQGIYAGYLCVLSQTG